MNEPTPSWAESLIHSNHRLADAIQQQASSLNALAAAIAQLAESQINDPDGTGDGADGLGAPPRYLDGSLG